MRFSGLSAILLLSACATTPGTPPLVSALGGTVYGTAKPATVRNLVIAVADDGVARPASFADRAAATLPLTVAVALDRPPVAGKGAGYTAEAIATLAQTVRAYRQRFPAARVILVGEGGGAALVANMVGTHMGLADAMLLAGCPCTLPEWRAMMAKRYPRTGYEAAVDSLDPLQTVGGIPTTLVSAIVVGEDDAITPPRFSRTYAEALALRGIAVDFRRLPERGHALLDDPQLMQVLATLATPVARTASR